jgi:hypothetical protein
MKWTHKTKQPIVLNKLQLRLACELAAQYAAREEIRRQISQQFPGRNITVGGCEVDITQLNGFDFTVDGREVIWQ